MMGHAGSGFADGSASGAENASAGDGVRAALEVGCKLFQGAGQERRGGYGRDRNPARWEQGQASGSVWRPASGSSASRDGFGNTRPNPIRPAIPLSVAVHGFRFGTHAADSASRTGVAVGRPGNARFARRRRSGRGPDPERPDTAAARVSRTGREEDRDRSSVILADAHGGRGRRERRARIRACSNDRRSRELRAVHMAGVIFAGQRPSVRQPVPSFSRRTGHSPPGDGGDLILAACAIAHPSRREMPHVTK